MTEGIITIGAPPVPKPWWEPTPQLRFVERDGRRILQQRWSELGLTFDGRRQPIGPTRWEDVPLVDEGMT